MLTIYPIYEFPLAVFWKTPHFLWKFAAETQIELLRIGPLVASFFIRGETIFGQHAVSNTFQDSPGILSAARTAIANGEYRIYNFPVELRRTITEIKFDGRPGVADLIFAGAASFFFENDSLSSVNLSAGLTFGYGYNINKLYDGGRFAVTFFPIYEFPLAIFWNPRIFHGSLQQKLTLR